MLVLPPRFINWRTIDGRKVPCRRDGSVIDPHDRANHVTREQAEQSQYDVGFVMCAEDGLFFLDLDKCYVNGAWTAESSAIFTSFGGAIGEISTSGTGLHIIGRCDPSRLSDRRNKWNGWLEFYTDKRFVAFGKTGWEPIGGTYHDRDWTDQLLRFVPQREHLGELPDGRDPAYTGPEDDDALIAIMLRSTGSAASAFGGTSVTVKDLWEANTAVLGIKYPSFDGKGDFDHSSADAALMSHLAFWTGKDMPRMDRLFRRSALMRDKYAKRDDYRRDTVQNAARLCKKVYDVPQRDANASHVSQQGHEAILSVPEMIEKFKGCVYVRDNHRVLVPDGSLLKPEQFNATYGGHVFQMMPDGTKPTGKAFEALTECRVHRFPQAKRTTFRADLAPGVIINDEVNIYVKPEVTRRNGDLTPFLDFLSKLVPDERDRTILLSWCAAMVQNPGVKFQWAIVMQGVEGNGKSLIARCLRYAIGDQYTYEPRASQLGSQFMSFDENMLLIVVEEVHMDGRRQLLDDLKPRITNERIEVEAKGQDKRLVRNTANWFMNTNHRSAIIKTMNDRRYCIFYTAQQLVTDLDRDGMGGDYFPKLYQWLKDGGYAFVAQYLHNYLIPDEFNPATKCHRAPMTTSTLEAIEMSRGGVESEIIEAIENNRFGFRGGWVSSWALEQLLKDKGYKISMPKRGEILRNMGFNNMGRSPRAILREDGNRPTLWKSGVPGNVEDYFAEQGPGYV